ncbi:MAG: hypothetical protein WBD71_08025 [Xanthobacteraceae bacterium]
MVISADQSRARTKPAGGVFSGSCVRRSPIEPQDPISPQETMRIVDIRETAVPINSTLANSGFDFSEMTTSVVAVITDVIRHGKPVVGFAFNSTGRYACGAQMRALHPAHSQRAAGNIAGRERRQFRAGKESRCHDAQ